MIGEKLRQLRKDRNLTLQELADDLNDKYQDKNRSIGFSKGKLSKWENGKEQPYLSSARLVADYFNVSVDYLIGRKTNEPFNDIIKIYDKLEVKRQKNVYNYANNQLIEQNQVHEATTVYVTSKLSAGPGVIDLDPTNVEEVQYDGYVPRHDLAFQVAGDSMEPLFEDGEIVFVERTEDIYSGQVIAVQINEESFIKKAYIENDQLRLVSLNSMYDDILADGTDNIRVVGRVIL